MATLVANTNKVADGNFGTLWFSPLGNQEVYVQINDLIDDGVRMYGYLAQSVDVELNDFGVAKYGYTEMWGNPTRYIIENPFTYLLYYLPFNSAFGAFVDVKVWTP